jgi:hypothetical protein
MYQTVVVRMFCESLARLIEHSPSAAQLVCTEIARHSDELTRRQEGRRGELGFPPGYVDPVVRVADPGAAVEPGEGPVQREHVDPTTEEVTVG